MNGHDGSKDSLIEVIEGIEGVMMTVPTRGYRRQEAAARCPAEGIGEGSLDDSVEGSNVGSFEAC